MSIEPGTRLLHYRVEAKIGEGGMGVVWRAEDSKLRRDVALKLLPEGLGGEPDRLARFEREARMLASLNHPNIATIHGLEQDGERRFLVLELVPGEALSKRLNEGTLEIEKSLKVCRDIARGLEAAHERSVIHRDLKPANVQLTDKGTVKVLDFGLAKTLAPVLTESQMEEQKTATMITAKQAVVGTTPYMSPEQAAGKPLDRRTDIWSFGCILYETLTGKRAFSGDTVSSTLAAIHGADPDWERLPPDTPARVRELLRRCLTKDPERRLHDIADARIELEDAIAERGVSDSPAPRPRRWWVGAAIVALLLVVGAVGKTWIDRDDGASPANVGKAGVHTIAVLPFADLSAAGDKDYLAEGLAAEVIHRLTRLPGTRVIGRQSSFSFKGRDVDLVAIGEALGVELILDGSVRLRDDQLRVQAELVRAADGFSVWSGRYDRQFDEAFRIQDNIARSIAEALEIELSVADMVAAEIEAYTSDMEAYRLYLQGRHLASQRGTDNLYRAIETFREAVDRDPDFAEAWAGIALAATALPGINFIELSRAEQNYGIADEAIGRALELDPDLVEANAVRALRLSSSKDWVDAERQFLGTLELAPNDRSTLFWLGNHQLLEGRFDEASVNLKRAYAIDPAWGILNFWLGHLELLRGNTTLAREHYDAALDAGVFTANNWIAWILIEEGDFEKALETAEPQIAGALLFPQVLDARANPALRPALAEKIRGADWRVRLVDALLMHDWELALGALDSMAEDSHAEGAFFMMIWGVEAAPLRRDPRFAEWTRRVGLVDAWNEFGWPEFCEPAGDGAVCH